MKNFLLLPILLTSLSLHGQKGATPVMSPLEAGRGVTRAVVIGISDYQDPAIPDLRFADKDAEAFVQWLKSPAGGSLPEDNMQVLLNERATLFQFVVALDWLMEHSKEGDQVIIYFSGHGDIDAKLIGQPGFLLMWDTPSRAYMAGAYGLIYFQIIITTLSEQNKAKVIVITDACHAGKLVGSSFGGAQITNANLAKQFANEVKILSCQPDEYSIEGEQWGGGRGAFSYHLVDGLYGMADRESDGVVTLSDIDRYLEDHVTKEVKPLQQTPMIVGSKSEQLTRVSPDVLAMWQKRKEGQPMQFKATEQRGLEDETLAKVDTNICKLYFAFKDALKSKVFLEPVGSCADAYYKKLMAVAELKPLYGAMTRNFAAALLDDSQQSINRFMQYDIREINIPHKKAIEKYEPYPRYLERAAELLGEQHYMYPMLQAYKHFFGGYNISVAFPRVENEAMGRQALSQFWKSLEWYPEFPLAYWSIAFIYTRNILQPDSAKYYLQQASRLAPNWAGPYTDLANILAEEGKLEEALVLLDTASMLDSNGTWISYGYVYSINNRRYEAEKMYLKALAVDSTEITALQNLGIIYLDSERYAEAEKVQLYALSLDSTSDWTYGCLGRVYRYLGRYDEAEKMFLKAIGLHSGVAWFFNNLGAVYLQQGKLEQAETALKKALELDSFHYIATQRLAIIKFRQGKVEEVRKVFEQLIKNYPDSQGYLHLGMSYILSAEGKMTEAAKWLELAIQHGMVYELIVRDVDLAPLRETTAYKALMRKHFPGKFKD